MSRTGCSILEETRVPAAPDAGYVPCIEAVLRRMYGLYSRSVAALDAAMYDFSGSKLLLQQLLTHGDARQVAALATTLAKATLRLARVAMGDGREEGGAVAVPGAAADAAGAKAQGPGSSKCTAAEMSSVSILASSCLLQIVREADQGVTRCAEAARSGSGGGDATSCHDSVEGAAAAAMPCETPHSGDGAGGGSGATGAQGDGSCAPSSARPGGCGEVTLALTSLALCRWLPLCAHMADMCRQRQQQQQQDREKQQQQQGLQQEEQQQSTADDPTGPLPVALRAGIDRVLHACDAAHEAGDRRALGSWRQLLYDSGSYRWVDERAADMARRETRWCDRGWSPGQAVGPRGQDQQKAKRQECGAEAEPDVGSAQQGGDAASSVSDHVQGRHGSASDLQQQGADQEQVGFQEHEQQQVNEQQGGKLGARYRMGWMPGGGLKLPYHLLPPSCDAVLLLPTCCHPLCTNLAGDSEAGMELRAWGGGAEGEGGEGEGEGCGGLLYCSRECRTAHARFRREQEAKELGWRTTRWGQGQ